MTDHPQFSLASLFEANPNIAPAMKVSQERSPTSVSPTVIQIDCRQLKEQMSLSTELETIRLEADHCSELFSLELQEHQTKLHTFRISGHKISSEFAYLKKGENLFHLRMKNKTIKIKVMRF